MPHASKIGFQSIRMGFSDPIIVSHGFSRGDRRRQKSGMVAGVWGSHPWERCCNIACALAWRATPHPETVLAQFHGVVLSPARYPMSGSWPLHYKVCPDFSFRYRHFWSWQPSLWIRLGTKTVIVSGNFCQRLLCWSLAALVVQLEGGGLRVGRIGSRAGGIAPRALS